MQVFKTFLQICIKNLPSSIGYVVAFLALSLILANTSSTNSDMARFMAQKVDVAVVDEDGSDLSKALYDYVDGSQNMKKVDMSNENWRDELFYHNVQYILVLHKGFGSALEQGKAEGAITAYTNPDSNSSFIVRTEVNTYLSSVTYYLKAGYSVGDASEKAAKAAAITADTKVEVSGKAVEKPTALSYFFSYVPYMLICIMINTLGPMLLIWNRSEIKARTGVSALSLGKRNLAIIGAMAAFAGLIFLLFVVVSIGFFGNELFTQRGLYYSINALVYVLVCLSITYLVAQLSKKQAALSMWSNAIGLSTSFLCGVFVMRDLLPAGVVSFSKCLPTYWYINITEELKYFDGSLSSLYFKSIGVQLLFALAIYAVALVIIKSKQQKM